MRGEHRSAAAPEASGKRSILIVEDDQDQLSRYMRLATMAGLKAEGACTKGRALTRLSEDHFDLLLSDIHLGASTQFDSFEGLEVLRHAAIVSPQTIALAMTSDPKIATYEQIQAVGVAHLFRKPIVSVDELALHVLAAERLKVAGKLPGRVPGRYPLPAHLQRVCPDGIVIDEALRADIRKFAVRPSAPIVMIGETGTGKEEIAKLSHRYRCEYEGRPVPFVPVNCANLVGDTANSTLFGHVKGAFTGAFQTTPGLLGQAHGGILFLDEIHALPLDCQQRLLRALNDGTYNRLGDSEVKHAQFQVVVASKFDLDDEVAGGRFLPDLRGRLIGLDVRLKPLRERQGDLPLLVEMGLARQGINLDPAQLQRLVERCASFYWQLNIRQLFSSLQALVIHADYQSALIRAEDLPVFPSMLPPKTLAKMPELSAEPSAVEAVQMALTQDRDLNTTLDAVEAAILRQACLRHRTVQELGDALGLARTTVAARLRRYGLRQG